jgi:hypothetical protein
MRWGLILGRTKRTIDRIQFDKREGRVEISATIADALAEALENSEELFAEGMTVTLTDIAGPASFLKGTPG